MAKQDISVTDVGVRVEKLSIKKKKSRSPQLVIASTIKNKSSM
jgi:hypothetical protein